MLHHAQYFESLQTDVGIKSEMHPFMKENKSPNTQPVVPMTLDLGVGTVFTFVPCTV